MSPFALFEKNIPCSKSCRRNGGYFWQVCRHRFHVHPLPGVSSRGGLRDRTPIGTWEELEGFFRRADFGTVSGADYAETGESLPADTFSHEKTLRGVLLHQSNGGTFVGFVEAFHSSVEGKGIEMIRSDQCAYIHEITAETLYRVFQGCTEDSLRT